MKLEKKRYKDIVILKFTGELESVNLPEFTEHMQGWMDGGDNKFILDTRLLTFINSSAFGYLMKLRSELDKEGGALVIARPSKFIRKTLVTYGVEDIFPPFETEEDAIMHLSKGAEPVLTDLEPAQAEPQLQGEVNVLFRPRVESGEQPPNQVGRIVSLYEDGIGFHFETKAELDPVALDLTPGTVLKLKFKIPFIRKDRYFEVDGKVSRTEIVERDEDTGRQTLLVRTEYEDIADEDRDDISGLVKLQDEWRKEVTKQ